MEWQFVWLSIFDHFYLSQLLQELKMVFFQIFESRCTSGAISFLYWHPTILLFLRRRDQQKQKEVSVGI